MPAGTYCRLVQIAVAGTRIEAQGEVWLTEDLFEGSHLRFDVESQEARGISIGNPIAVEVQGVGGDAGNSGTFRLWCTRIERRQEGGRPWTRIEATDPLSLAQGQTQFRTHRGRVRLLKLAKTVLEQRPGPLPEGPRFAGESPTISLGWMLQAQEAGGSFLRRIAAICDCVLYWDREDVSCGGIGSGPTDAREEVHLEFGKDLVTASWAEVEDLQSTELRWTDPDTRAVQRRRVNDGSSNGRGRLADRISSGSRPPAFPRVRAARQRPVALELACSTLRADLRLGSHLVAAGGPKVLVERIEHWFGAGGSYWNRVGAVKPQRWAVGGMEPARGATGPFQAEVRANTDPGGLGRVRVTLCEDPDQLQSPWISTMYPYAGKGTGTHWVPETGDLVLVVAEAESPENLYCLGTLRGRDQRVPVDWRHGRNAVKTLFANGGIGIYIDDQRGTLRLQTEKARLELGPRGDVTLQGRTLDVQTHQSCTLKGGQRVVIDASRIDLG